MGWELALYAVGLGLMIFFMTGLESCVKVIMTSKVKIAEANARTEEARLERVRLEKSDR